jgi:hypothetical protein
MIIPVWIVSIGLVTVGIALLSYGIKQILKSVGGDVLLKLPLTQKSGQFVVTNPGQYAIWQSGRSLQRVPVKIAVPTISELPSGEMLSVHPAFSSVWVSNGWESRVQVFTFWAEAGQHKLDLPSDTVLPESPYSLEIRERKPGYLLVLSILLLLVGAACLITGMVLPWGAGV